MKDKKNIFSGQDADTDKTVSKRLDDVKIMFLEERKYDLHVGREMITFRGRETKAIPRAWLKHPDFIQMSKLFVVKGV